jgi:serine/threonine-protein kinase RsbW
LFEHDLFRKPPHTFRDHALLRIFHVTDEAETRQFGMSGSEVAAIDNWLEMVGARWGASERTMFSARLCVAELAANALEHGIARADADHMVVTVRRLGGGVDVEFLDSRAPFDPTVTPPPERDKSITSADPTGRGLTLLHAYAKDLKYSHDGTYNRIRLTIRPE